MVNKLSEKIRARAHLVRGVLFELQEKLDIVVVVARRHVKMEMKHRLTCRSPIIGKYVKAVRLKGRNNGLRHHLGGTGNRGELCLGNINERFAVRDGNDKNVAVVNRIDIEDGDRMLISLEDLRVGFTANDPTEFTSTHSGSFCCR